MPLKRTDAEVKRIENMILSAFNGAHFQLEIEPYESALSYFHRPIQRRVEGVETQTPGVICYRLE